jgi:hypothetical protein
MKYSFDSKCLELAEHFLPSYATQECKNELAQWIQNAVEDFCGATTFLEDKAAALKQVQP